MSKGKSKGRGWEGRTRADPRGDRREGKRGTPGSRVARFHPEERQAKKISSVSGYFEEEEETKTHEGRSELDDLFLLDPTPIKSALVLNRNRKVGTEGWWVDSP